MKRFLSDDVLHYLQVQEQFESLRLATVQQHGRNMCDMAYANPYDGPVPQAIEAMQHALETTHRLNLQYTPYGGNTMTRRLVAQHLSKSHGKRFPWRQVVLTPGSMAALNLVFRSMFRKWFQSKCLIITPCWLDYPLYLTNLGIQPVMVPVDPVTKRLDLNAIEAALDDEVAGVILSQPANPTGLIYNAEELHALGELLSRSPQQPLLISDECHRGIIFDDTEFVSPVRYYPNTCVVYSFGKSLQIQGQRIGYVAVSPDMERADEFAVILERLCRIMGFCTPTALMQIAIRELLDAGPNLKRLQNRRDLLYNALTDAGYQVVKPQSTFFMFPKAGDVDDMYFARELARHGVLVTPSSLFHYPGHFRVSITCNDEMLARALPIFQQVLAGCCS